VNTQVNPNLAADEEAARLAIAWEIEHSVRNQAIPKNLKSTLTLKAFIQAAWSVVEPATAFIPGWHLDAISDHLEAVSKGQIRNLLINIPPRHMKSLAVSVFWPTWEWTFAPSVRWLFASYAESLSKRDSLKCRRLIDSLWYKAKFGHIFSLTSDQNEKMRFENDKTGYRIATSVGGSGTGEGGNRIVVDDPHNATQAQSDTQRESALTWWDQTMATRLNDPQKDTKVIVMQRLHERDLSGHVLEQGGYEHLCLPAEYEPKTFISLIGWSDPRTQPGELLWPARFREQEITRLKRDLGSYAAAGQLQQRPSPAEGGMLKRFWWRYWKPRGSDLGGVMIRMADGSYQTIEPVELPETFDEILQSWDMSFKDATAAKGGDPDSVAGGVWGRLDANKYFLDLVCAQMDFPQTCSAVIALSQKWPNANAKLVEDKANGPAVIATLRNKIAGLIAVEPEGGKVARVNAVSPGIESGNVFIPHPLLYAWVDPFVEECAAFPNGAHDDRVDQMSQALVRLGAVVNAFEYA